MISPISYRNFAVAFGVKDQILYEIFAKRISDQLRILLHPSVEVENFAIVNTWKDAGNNIHCGLEGSVTAFGTQAQIGGEIVYLIRSRSFRGNLWSTSANPSDTELLSLARESFRSAKYVEADGYLTAICHRELLPRSVHSLQKLLLKQIGESALLSTDSLANDWLRPEEENAWKDSSDL